MTAPDPYMIQTLLGDIRLEQLVINTTDPEPWYSFGKARAEEDRGDSASALSTVRAVAMAQDIEARYRVLAWNLVRQLGGQLPRDGRREVLGVLVEIGMRERQDLLAAYLDRTAYYYNYSGAAVVWVRPDSSLDQTIDKVLEAVSPEQRQLFGCVRPPSNWSNSRGPDQTQSNVRPRLHGGPNSAYGRTHYPHHDRQSPN
jgi:hypothetical protein